MPLDVLLPKSASPYAVNNTLKCLINGVGYVGTITLSSVHCVGELIDLDTIEVSNGDRITSLKPTAPLYETPVL